MKKGQGIVQWTWKGFRVKVKGQKSYIYPPKGKAIIYNGRFQNRAESIKLLEFLGVV